jgi:pimeloyl-CoA synthetase
MNKQTFEKTLDRMLDISIQGINRAVAIKQREIQEKEQIIKKLQAKLKHCKCQKEAKC